MFTMNDMCLAAQQCSRGEQIAGQDQQNKKLQWMVEPHRPWSKQTPSRKGRGINSQIESSL